jgi:nucleoside triphosphate diphosphatase
MATSDKRDIRTLLQIMARLRDPLHGCPWDREQTFATIAPFTIEEAYEVADAIDRDDLADLRDELGDLLLQVVFHARIAEEQQAFDFGGIVSAISEKMIRRHPHVFAGVAIATADEQSAAWEELKASERTAKSDPSALAGVGLALPALTRAWKLGKRAARVGFDWPEINGVIDKAREELDEFVAAQASSNRRNTEEEIGDLLFTVANLARHARVDPEQALRAANRKFEQRFREMESQVAATGRSLASLDAEELDSAWEAVKADEPAP